MGFASLLLQCFGPLIRLAEHPRDGKDDRLRKAMLIPISIVVFATNQAAFIIAWLQDRLLSIVFTELVAVLSLVVCLIIISTKSCGAQLAGMYATTIGVVYIVTDFWTYGWVGYYTISVLVMDMLLLCNCHENFTSTFFFLTVVGIVIGSLEQAYGMFGLYAAIPESWSGYDRPTDNSGKHGYFVLAVRLAVFGCDFYMTRYFSRGLREQRENVERSVAVAQQVAATLVRFDLEEAEELMKSADGLPSELHRAFCSLLANLRSYKPYLPQSCLPSEVEAVTATEDTTHVSECPMDTVSVASSISYAPQPNHLVSRAVTLLAINARHFLHIAEQKPPTAVTCHAAYMGVVLEAAKESRGLVEHFICDRVLVSFNAMKQCGSHRMQGLSCADRLRKWDWRPEGGQRLELSMAVSCGNGLCGPLGCEGLRSYAVVGAVGAWVPLLERIAARFSLWVVTDTTVTSSTSEACNFRFLGKACFAKLPTETEIFEFTGVKEMVNEEWMYQLEMEGSWEVYNSIRRKVADGEVVSVSDLPENASDELLREVTAASASYKQYKLRWRINDVGVEEERAELTAGS